MVAMPAAAAGPDRKSVGIDQSGGFAELMPMFTSVSARMTLARAAPVAPAMTSPPEATRHGSTTCHDRSPLRSEWRAQITIARTDTVGGMAFRKPTVIELTPSCLMIWGDQMPSV